MRCRAQPRRTLEVGSARHARACRAMTCEWADDFRRSTTSGRRATPLGAETARDRHAQAVALRAVARAPTTLPLRCSRAPRRRESLAVPARAAAVMRRHPDEAARWRPSRASAPIAGAKQRRARRRECKRHEGRVACRAVCAAAQRSGSRADDMWATGALVHLRVESRAPTSAEPACAPRHDALRLVLQTFVHGTAERVCVRRAASGCRRRPSRTCA